MTRNNESLTSFDIKNGIVINLYESKNYKESKGEIRQFDNIFS